VINNGVYELYFASCMTRAAPAASYIRCLYNEQNKTYTPFLSHIILLLIYRRF